jgi:hypothetical protein
MRRRWTLIAFLIPAAVFACGTDPSGDPCAAVTPTVAMEGPAPVFAWTASCPMGAIDVTPADSADVFAWFALADPGQNTILPPVTFGGAAEGASVGSPTTDSLISGRSYRVHLLRSVSALQLALVGEAEFTAP